MASVNFLYRSLKDKSCLNLRLLFRFNGNDHVIAAGTNLEVSKDYWKNKHKLKVKDISVINKQIEINTEINKITNHILKAFEQSGASDLLNKQWLDKQLNSYYNRNTKIKTIPKDIVRFIEYYVEQRLNEVKPASITKFKVVKHKLQRLENHIGRSIFINEINEEFKELFVNYCKGENYSQNTMQRELNIIKMFCKFAKYKGVDVHIELEGLKLNKEKTEKIYLSLKEIDQIEAVQIDKPYLINARDWLIISCFTGQRISDFMRFNKEMIRVEDSKTLLEFDQQKTGKTMTIPLHSKVTSILKKYNGDFPKRISDQRYNDYLKEVCKIAKLNQNIQGKKQINISKDPLERKVRRVEGMYPKYELVTSHIGRRSFATNHYGKIPTSYLIYVTGHSSEEMFLNYIGKSNKDMALELTKYF
jgi:integrase